MARRLGLLAALPLLLAAPAAHDSTFMGSPDVAAQPDSWVGATETDVGFRQFALRGAPLEAPEDGVLVSAEAQATRIAGDAQPRIAVLRPDEDGVGVTIAASAPVAVSSPTGDLHLPVREGDSIGLVLPAGQVELAVRGRPRPDGAAQRFTLPCEPCGTDGGTGTELLFGAVVEPDFDEDGLGDESQDPDGGGLGLDWEDDWFEDYEEGDELDEAEDLSPRARPLRLLAVDRRRGDHAARDAPHRRRAVHHDPHRRGRRRGLARSAEDEPDRADAVGAAVGLDERQLRLGRAAGVPPAR